MQQKRRAGGKTLISLFAGAGGLDLGLEDAGFETVLATDLEAYACRTLLANKNRPPADSSEFAEWFADLIRQRCYAKSSEAELFQLHHRLSTNPVERPYFRRASVLQGDIRDLPSEQLLDAAHSEAGDVFLVAGGPPCQPFSRAGKRETVEAATGRLFLDFVRVVRDTRPRWFLFENVKGLTLSRTDVLDLACQSCGHEWLPSFDTRYLLASRSDANLVGVQCPDCGATDLESRWRSERGGSLEIILNELRSTGYTCHWTVLNAADFGAPQVRERLVIVGSRDNEPFEWPHPSFTRESKGDAQLALPLAAAPSRPWRTMYEALWCDGHPLYGALDKNKAVLWVKNVVRPHDEPVTWSLDRVAPTIGAHQGAKLAIAPNGVPIAQLERQQWHVLGHRQGDRPPVPVEHEYLTDEELLRLQTFPPGWFLFGTRMERAFQIGNAVPPVLGRALGEAILACSEENAPRR